MTRLLVSVRSVEEAADAVAAGADLIDVKEPSAGSLGAASPDVVAGVMRAVDGRRPTSVALGELNGEPRRAGAAWLAMAELLPEERLPQFAKVGLAGCAKQSDWPDRWAAALALLPVAVSPVAVVYADWQTALAPAPGLVLQHAQPQAAGQGGQSPFSPKTPKKGTVPAIRCRAVLVDTFDKRGPGLLELWPPAELARFVESVQEAGMTIVLGGQITADQFDRLLPLAPDFIAVRGAACRGSRAGRIDPRRIEQLRERLSATIASTPDGAS